MKRLALGVALAIVAASLTGCGDPDVLTPSDRYRFCIEHGGDYQRGAWGEESCVLPESTTNHS